MPEPSAKLVDNKSAAIDGTWQALCFVDRREHPAKS